MPETCVGIVSTGAFIKPKGKRACTVPTTLGLFLGIFVTQPHQEKVPMYAYFSLSKSALYLINSVQEVISANLDGPALSVHVQHGPFH